MSIIVITRKVDRADALAGFAYEWVRELARHVERLHVIAWQRSSSEGLPPNVTLTSLHGGVVLKSVQMQLALWRMLPHVKGIFCHMNPEYTILAAPAARFFKKRVVCWYTHRAVTLRRKLMEFLADRILTASASSFRRALYSAKVVPVGHGIDTDLFSPPARAESHTEFRILTVGRLSPAKRYETMIDALALLDNDSIELDIIGGTIMESQQEYQEQLRRLVKEKKLEGRIRFIGWVPHLETAGHYRGADLFVNMSETGSLDKAVLEAMACGVPVLTSNEAFAEILEPRFMVKKNDAHDLAEKISAMMKMDASERHALGMRLRAIVVEHHNLAGLAKKIIGQFS